MGALFTKEDAINGARAICRDILEIMERHREDAVIQMYEILASTILNIENIDFIEHLIKERKQHGLDN